jgi:hypothetical protein
VRIGDWLFSRELFDEGDWVPSFESLFFLEDFPESLPRESTLWLKRFIFEIEDAVTLAVGRTVVRPDGRRRKPAGTCQRTEFQTLIDCSARF